MSANAGGIADPGAYRDDIKKRVARGAITTFAATTTTEVGVLRLDGVSVAAGRTYTIRSSTLQPYSTVANDYIGLKIRASTTDTATTASTALMAVQSRYTGASGNETDQVVVTYNPAADATLSILLTVSRISGTGNVGVTATATSPIELWIDDMGQDPGNTGVAP